MPFYGLLVSKNETLNQQNTLCETNQLFEKEIDNKTESKYIDTLFEAYLFYKVNRYGINGKQHLTTQEKYYLVDLGFRNALLGKELTSDAAHLLENIIYLELKRRNNQVWIGKTNNLEVDFVVRNNNGFTQYI